MSLLVRKMSEKRTNRRAERKQTVLSSLIKQRDQAIKMKESEIVKELQEQIDSICSPPSIDSVYRIMLSSSHYRSYSGTFLDAHRSMRKDRKTMDTTYVMVHTDFNNMKKNKLKEREERKQLAGHWQLESLTKEELMRDYPILTKKLNVFRLKLLTSHFGCPSNGYLSAVSVYYSDDVNPHEANNKVEKISNKNKSFRSKHSNWCFVRPLWSCNEYTSNLWTLEPVDNKYGENGLWKIRLISKYEAYNIKPLNKKTTFKTKSDDNVTGSDGNDSSYIYEKEYLEVHRSKLTDVRNPHSTFVHVHTNAESHVGEWFFEQVYAKNKMNGAAAEDNEDNDDEDDSRDKNVKFNGRTTDVLSTKNEPKNDESDVLDEEVVPLGRRIVTFTGSFFTSKANQSNQTDKKQ